MSDFDRGQINDLKQEVPNRIMKSMQNRHTIDSEIDRLIPLREAAGMLGLDPSTIRKRAAGTELLTLVPQGRKLFLVRGEVIAHRQRMIENARRHVDVLTLIRR